MGILFYSHNNLKYAKNMQTKCLYTVSKSCDTNLFLGLYSVLDQQKKKCKSHKHPNPDHKQPFFR